MYAGASSPHVVLIYPDDHVPWVVGGYENKEVHTPQMDQLAEVEMQFTQR